MPNIETIFTNMKDATTFAKLDLTSAYWQIELDEKTKHICNINTSEGGQIDDRYEKPILKISEDKVKHFFQYKRNSHLSK